MCVFLWQAVLDFHKQVGNVVAQISEQYKELFGTGGGKKEDFRREQMRIQLMDALITSGRHFAFKDQLRVRTYTSLIKGYNKESEKFCVYFSGVVFFFLRLKRLCFCCVARCCEDRAWQVAAERCVHWPPGAQGFSQQALRLPGGWDAHSSQQGDAHTNKQGTRVLIPPTAAGIALLSFSLDFFRWWWWRHCGRYWAEFWSAQTFRQRG